MVNCSRETAGKIKGEAVRGGGGEGIKKWRGRKPQLPQRRGREVTKFNIDMKRGRNFCGAS